MWSWWLGIVHSVRLIDRIICVDVDWDRFTILYVAWIDEHDGIYMYSRHAAQKGDRPLNAS